MTIALHRIFAIVERDFEITRSYRLAFVLDLIYGLLSLAVYFFISRTFAGVRSSQLAGAPTYFAFAAVGVAAGVVIESASAAVARRVRDEQLTGTLEALVAQPLPPVQLCLGLVGFPFAFAIVRAILYLAVAAFWIHPGRTHASWLGVAAVLITSGIALSSLGVLAAAIVLVVKRGELLVANALYGMVLLSGSVFPISALPSWLEDVGRVMPLRFALDGIRAAMFGGTTHRWAHDVLVLALFGLLGMPVAVWSFGRALGVARRAGSLGQY